MTKSEEMALYDAFVRKLPEDSYLHPWLSTVRDCVANDLRCDIIPRSTPREVFAECQQIRDDAKSILAASRDNAAKEADRIIAHATVRAKEITSMADRQAESTRRELHGDIARLRDAMTAIAA